MHLFITCQSDNILNGILVEKIFHYMMYIKHSYAILISCEIIRIDFLIDKNIASFYRSWKQHLFIQNSIVLLKNTFAFCLLHFSYKYLNMFFFLFFHGSSHFITWNSSEFNSIENVHKKRYAKSIGNTYIRPTHASNNFQ